VLASFPAHGSSISMATLVGKPDCYYHANNNKAFAFEEHAIYSGNIVGIPDHKG